MPVYLLTCVGCGRESELLVSEIVEHGSTVEVPSQACSCGCSTYRKSTVAGTADCGSLWAKQCRIGWLESPEAKSAISGKGFDVH